MILSLRRRIPATVALGGLLCGRKGGKGRGRGEMGEDREGGKGKVYRKEGKREITGWGWVSSKRRDVREIW